MQYGMYVCIYVNIYIIKTLACFHNIIMTKIIYTSLYVLHMQICVYVI